MTFASNSVHILSITREYALTHGLIDVIIVEDDPYYFLQEGDYVPKVERSTAVVKHEQKKFLSSLVPSYLKFDYQGRVIRLDTFSKVSHTQFHMFYVSLSAPQYVAPGSRLGYFTCSPLLAERLERQGETTTQAPCGFGQVSVPAE